MNESKLENIEAIALIFIITINHSVFALSNSILNSAGSSSIINILYVGVIAILLTLLICKLLSKFPGWDILDISEFLGGKVLKVIVGVMFFIYFIFTASMLLRIFANCLQILYFPATNIFFIISLFIIAISFACSLKYNAISRTNLIITPIVMFSLVFLSIAAGKYFQFENIFPILGNGFNATFLSGATNLCAFSGLVYLYLLPPTLKNTNKFKNIATTSTILSLVFLILNIATILFMFNTFSLSNELIPLYSVIRYIEFGTFFQRLDSIFILILTLSFACYLGIITNFALSIFKKVTNIQNSKLIIYPFALIILASSLIQNTGYISNFLENTVFRYAFLALVLLVGLPILIFANFKKQSYKE